MNSDLLQGQKMYSKSTAQFPSSSCLMDGGCLHQRRTSYKRSWTVFDLHLKSSVLLHLLQRSWSSLNFCRAVLEASLGWLTRKGFCSTQTIIMELLRKKTSFSLLFLYPIVRLDWSEVLLPWWYCLSLGLVVCFVLLVSDLTTNHCPVEASLWLQEPRRMFAFFLFFVSS